MYAHHLKRPAPTPSTHREAGTVNSVRVGVRHGLPTLGPAALSRTAGRVVFITGEIGTGKTVLAHHLAHTTTEPITDWTRATDSSTVIIDPCTTVTPRDWPHLLSPDHPAAAEGRNWAPHPDAEQLRALADRAGRLIVVDDQARVLTEDGAIRPDIVIAFSSHGADTFHAAMALLEPPPGRDPRATGSLPGIRELSAVMTRLEHLPPFTALTRLATGGLHLLTPAPAPADGQPARAGL